MRRLALPLPLSSESGCGTHLGGTVIFKHSRCKDDLSVFMSLFCVAISLLSFICVLAPHLPSHLVMELLNSLWNTILVQLDHTVHA